MHSTTVNSPMHRIWLNIYRLMIGSSRLFGGSLIYSSSGGSPANARPASVSIMMLIHSICTTVTGVSMPMNGPMMETPTAHRFIVSWKMMNFRMLLKMVRPYRIARAMEAKLSLRITISPASLATSVPLPIAKPTSAFLRAGASLMPSPVMPATSPIDWASCTSRLLSDGRARATTRSFGSSAFTSSSLIAASSALVITAPLCRPFSLSSPASRAMAAAVSLLSPVIITT